MSERLVWLVRFWGALAISQVWIAAAFVAADVSIVPMAVAGAVWVGLAGVYLFVATQADDG